VWTSIGVPVVALHSGGGYLWAVLRGEDSIAQIDPAEPGTPVTSAVGRGPTQVMVVGDRVFVANRYDHSLSVLDRASTQRQENPLVVPRNPYALASDGRSVWVTSLADDTVTRIALP
jgi:DNA-binding beta-propeller fold protein YncE